MSASGNEHDSHADRVSREASYHESVYAESARLQGRFAHVFACPNALHAEQVHWEAIRTAVAGKVVLDYGCAEGQFTEELLACSPQAVYGIDLGEKAIERAQAKNLPSATFVVGDAHRLPWPDQHFDVIVGRAILHHLDLSLATTELLRVLRPGGKMFFVEPLYHNPLTMVFRWLTPNARTRDEKPLERHEVRRIDARFRSQRHGFSLLVSMAVGAFTSLLPGVGPSNWLLRMADRTDRLLAHTPLRWWMGQIYLRYQDPRSALLPAE